jgi:hypothetical protein
MDEKGNDQNKESPSPLPRLTARLEWLGNLRDGILVSVAIFYAAGYLVWAIYAWQNNLGLLPALEFQYFVAGVFPVAILAAAILGAKLLRRFVFEYWSKRVGSEATGVWKLVRILTLCVFGGVFVVRALGPAGVALFLVGFLVLRTFVTPYEQLPAWRKGWRLALVFLFGAFLLYLQWREDAITAAILGDRAQLMDDVLVIAFSISWFFLPPIPVLDWLTRIYRSFYIYGAIIYLTVAGFLLYQDRIYPNLPQEFGGVQPRCAHMDVSVAEISPETRQIILPAGKANGDSKTVRSVQVEVLFSKGDLLMVRPHGDYGMVYEIKKDNIQAITWCD